MPDSGLREGPAAVRAAGRLHGRLFRALLPRRDGVTIERNGSAENQDMVGHDPVQGSPGSRRGGASGGP